MILYLDNSKDPERTAADRWLMVLSFPLGGDPEFIFIKEEPAFYIRETALGAANVPWGSVT